MNIKDLHLVKVLVDVDLPLVTHYLDNDGQNWMLFWHNFEQSNVEWLLCSIDEDLLPKINNPDHTQAVTARDIQLTARTVYRIVTDAGGALLSQTRVTELAESDLSAEGSYINFDAWLSSRK